MPALAPDCHPGYGSTLSCYLPQRLLEHLGRLASGDQMAVIDDHRRHRVDALLQIELLALADLGRVLVRGQDGAGSLHIEADLGHLASPWEVHRQWVTRLEEEMFLQGDKERAAGMPVSPLMDRHKTGITKSQVRENPDEI